MSRKREKPYNFSRHTPYNFPKRRRPLPAETLINDDDKQSFSGNTTTGAIIITGLSTDSSVLDLKSRFEIYGSISRTRMDSGGIAYITFRSKDSAESAIAASLDPSFGITLNSNKVQVTWADDEWREGAKNKEASSSSASKLLKPELPLSRHGRRGNKLGSTIVNPRDDNNEKTNVRSRLSFPTAGREIIAYDDIL